MNNNFDAIENINIIKSTIEESKIHYKGLYKLCFILGIYNSIGFILSFLSFFFSTLAIINIFLFPVLTVLVLISYLIIYNKEKVFSNKYYLSIIDTWALMVIVVPVCITITRLIQYFLQIPLYNASLNKISGFSDILLFSIIIVIYSSIANRRYMKLLAIITLFFYLLLDNCFINIGLPLSHFTSKLAFNQASLSISSIYSFFITCIGYMVLGAFLKKKVAS